MSNARKIVDINRVVLNGNKYQDVTLACGCNRLISGLGKKVTVETAPELNCVNEKCPEKESHQNVNLK